ncbi:MAG: hypothetical protein GX629_06765, partial [Phycisphaerae bacterium]|nr:hypothetical protein [Phycisphaerae bacterium]
AAPQEPSVAGGRTDSGQKKDTPRQQLGRLPMGRRTHDRLAPPVSSAVVAI